MSGTHSDAPFDDPPADVAAVIDLLERRGERVERWSTTHVSRLIFTATRTYKLKRAVLLPFVDLSTVERRRAVLERELVLNRRLAPDVYLAVEVVADARGRAIDHVLVMTRLPDTRRLAAIVAGGVDATACVDAVAHQLARFHAHASRGTAIDELASHAAMTNLWRAGFEQWRPFVGRVLDADAIARFEHLTERYLAGRAAAFARRIADGHAVDGHGDLLADDVFCLDDGPRILDCLEFDDALRAGDTLADIAFLAMDLERLGAAPLASRLLGTYAKAAGDSWPRSLEHHYVAYRAHVRTKVACLRSAEDSGAPALAHELLELGLRHAAAARVRLVLVGGLPGTGKTTVARSLADAAGAVLLRSDVVRKELVGLAPTDRAGAPVGAGIYDARSTAATYRALLEAAAEHLRGGWSVVLDATWGSAADRSAAWRVAQDTASDVIAIECRAPRDIVAARIAARAEGGGDASDADLAVHDAAAARFAPWPDATVVDTDRPVASAIDDALAAYARER